MRVSLTLYLLLRSQAAALLLLAPVLKFNPTQPARWSRGDFLRAAGMAPSVLVMPVLSAPLPSEGEFLTDLDQLTIGLGQLDDLLENWDAATLNCNYAEVNRRLLQTENKQELLDEALTNSLISKNSRAVTTVCKRDPEEVRRILGIDTSIRPKSGPAFGGVKAVEYAPAALVRADKRIRRGYRRLEGKAGAEDYIEAEEAWLSSQSGLQSLTYAAGAADIGSVVAVDPGDEDSASSFLDQSRQYATDSRTALRTIVRLLGNLDKAEASEAKRGSISDPSGPASAVDASAP